MGEIVEFPSNGHTCSGYVSVATSGGGPGLIVIQEWWGLVPHIQEVVDRFAAAGFTALAPDLYHGEKTTEPDEAGKLMMALNMGEAARDMGGAIDFLLARDDVTTATVGVTGFCMGGGLALLLAAQRPDAVSACVPYYGLIPWPDAEPDWSKVNASILGHFAELDAFFGPEQVRALEEQLRAHGKQVELIVHPGVDHAFFNDHRDEVHDPETSKRTFDQSVQFLRNTIR
jgi:carboxymethylenebutenolidase